MAKVLWKEIAIIIVLPYNFPLESSKISHSRQWTLSETNKNDGKLASNCFRDLAPSDLLMLSDFKEMLTTKRFNDNKEVIANTADYLKIALIAALPSIGLLFLT